VRRPSHARRGPKITRTDDKLLCETAGFCENLVDSVWDMVEHVDDDQVRFQLLDVVEQCPLGRLVDELADGSLEHDQPGEVSVTKDVPYGVTGEIEFTLSEGRTMETRNRTTLCRCGQSSNSPSATAPTRRLDSATADVTPMSVNRRSLSDLERALRRRRIAQRDERQEGTASSGLGRSNGYFRYGQVDPREGGESCPVNYR
jgi:hypothetical protein